MEMPACSRAHSGCVCDYCLERFYEPLEEAATSTVSEAPEGVGSLASIENDDAAPSS